MQEPKDPRTSGKVAMWLISWIASETSWPT